MSPRPGRVATLALSLLLLGAALQRAEGRAILQDGTPLTAPAPAPGPGESAVGLLPAGAPTGEVAPEPEVVDVEEEAPAEPEQPVPEPGDVETEEQDGPGGTLTVQSNSLATQGPVPPATGFTPVRVEPAFAGTCEFQQGLRERCDDGMGVQDGTTPQDYRLLHDPDQVERCGLIPLSDVVNSISEWAYRGRWGGCGIRAYTAARVCVGEGIADGRWRARVLLWPDGECIPLCVKMTGQGTSVVEYGRTANC